MSDDDSNDLPAVPDSVDTNDEMARATQQIAGLDDEAAAAKIGSRTSAVAVIIGLVMVGGAAYLGVVTYQRDQASQHRWEAFHAAQNAPSEAEYLRMLREDLPNTDFTDVRQEYINEFAEHHDAAAVPLLIPILDEAGPMRAHAARALAAIGSPAADSAKADLLRVLPSCDIRDRAPVVWALAVLGEAGAANAIIDEFAAGRLQHQHAFDPRVITNVLGVGRLATPELTDHESVGVRTLVAQALAEAATPDVIAPLSHMIENEQRLEDSDDDSHGDHAAHDSVIRACIGGLGRVGDPRAASPLFSQMQRNAGTRVAVLEALRRTTGARGLAVLLTAATDDATKTDLVGMLRATHDPAAADALASQLDSADEHLRMEAASGLAEIADVRAVPVLVQLAQSTSLETGRDALDMLMLVRSPEVASALIPMLGEERFLGRRASVIRVLGRTGSPDAGRELMQHLDGDDIASAATALAELNYDPAFDALLRMIPRPRDVDFSAYQGMAGVPHEMEYNNRTAAVRALGRFGRPEAAPALQAIIEDPQDDIRLRNDAGLALGAVATDEILETVIGKIQQTDLDEVARRFYLGALWQHPSRAVAGRLMDLMTNPATPPDVRHPAAIAIGYTADPANDERLIALLDNHDMAFDAAIGIVLGGSDAAARALLAKLGADDDLRQSLQTELMNSENDFFNLVTGELWESGEVYRRLRVAEILNEGDGDNRQGYAWQTFAARLQSGWSGVHGMTANDIRQRMLVDIDGPDAERRQLIARALGAMNATGLLMAARDGGGAGAEDAREVLFQMNRPQTDEAPIATE